MLIPDGGVLLGDTCKVGPTCCEQELIETKRRLLKSVTGSKGRMESGTGNNCSEGYVARNTCPVVPLRVGSGFCLSRKLSLIRELDVVISSS